MKVTLEVRLVCPDCEAVGIRSAHGTTVAQCEAIMGRTCDHPAEHHPARRRRPRITAEVKR